MMRSFIRVAIPLLIAAATPATIYCAHLYMSSGFYGANLQLALAFGLVFVVALFHAVTFGLPAYFLAERFDLTTWWMSILCGAAIGMIPMAILDAATTPKFVTQPQYLRVLSVAGGFGMSGGFAAWLTWYLLGRCMAGALRAD